MLWGTMAIFSCHFFIFLFIGTSSTIKFPFVESSKPAIILIKVVLPEPVFPLIATLAPFFVMFMPFKIFYFFFRHT